MYVSGVSYFSQKFREFRERKVLLIRMFFVFVDIILWIYSNNYFRKTSLKNWGKKGRQAGTAGGPPYPPSPQTHSDPPQEPTLRKWQCARRRPHRSSGPGWRSKMSFNLQDTRYVIDTITSFFAYLYPENSVFSRKVGKNSGNCNLFRHFLEICENPRNFRENLRKSRWNLILKCKTLRISLEMLAKFAKVWWTFAEILRVERCKSMKIL